MALCILFFGACAAVLGWKALGNDSGVILNGVLTLSENGASIFYWILTALSLGFVVLAVIFIVQNVLSPQVVQITKGFVSIPLGFLKKKIKQIEFSDVTDFYETEVQGQRFFYLYTPQKKYYLNRVLMPSNEAYEEAKALISSAILEIRRDCSEQAVPPKSDRAGG